MITPAYAETMARYNRWQNQSLYAAASRLTDAQRRENRGAFFGSVHGTLCHLTFADRAWMWRFTGDAALRPMVNSTAETATFIPDWATLQAERMALDGRILSWASALTPTDLAADLTYASVTANRQLTKPMALLVAHMFNHQTHHRGQAHALLTGFGLSLEDTDLIMMPVLHMMPAAQQA
jgi:uncharacterized damage-inducible protein DinB